MVVSVAVAVVYFSPKNIPSLPLSRHQRINNTDTPGCQPNPLMSRSTCPRLRRRSASGLVFVAYFWVSGGMYGVEPLMRMAPPAYVFLTMLLTPLVYCIPISLICTDLSIAYPFDGGYVAWIDLAFGPVIGAHNMFWSVTCSYKCVPHPLCAVLLRYVMKL